MIVGYLGTRSAVLILVEDLMRLEHRGCDPAEVAVIQDGRLEARLRDSVRGTLGVGHTHWAAR